MLNQLVNSSDLEHLEMLRPNSQKQRNPTSNLRNSNDPLIRQEKYRKRRGMKGSKALKGC